MFESAELGHAIAKERYKKEMPELRTALLEAQLELVELKKFSLIVVIGGVDGAGKGETVNLLNEWMDPRYIQTLALDHPNEEEQSRPAMWRYWRTLPPKGRLGIYFGSWYTAPILDRVKGQISRGELDARVDEIVRFERMLTNEGALVVKLWFHLSKKSQRTRLKDLEKDSSTKWRVTKQDWKHFELYDDFKTHSERVLRKTSSEVAPWVVVEGGDARYRSLTVGRVLLDAMRTRIEAAKNTKVPKPPKTAKTSKAPTRKAPILPSIDKLFILRTLDLKQTIDKKDYDAQLEDLTGKLHRLSRHPRFGRLSVVSVFEGSDAAGKGGTIRRITGALDARQYRIIPIAAPTEDELAQPYLWRFWQKLPPQGKWAIFDRSWYGRVLVERVEEYCQPNDWMRAYGEINDFEEQLVRNRTVVLKFWLTISKDEQLRRFKERQKIDFKRFKITADDWRNRKKWDDYELAACDMIDRTSTEFSPWTLIESNDKQFARIKVLKTIVDRLERAL